MIENRANSLAFAHFLSLKRYAMKISLTPKKVTLFVTLIALSLTGAHLFGLVIRYFLSHNNLFGLIPLFDIRQENNIPTWYSSWSLLFCALLLGLITVAKKTEGDRYVVYWAVLALAFVFLSLDEMASLHEKTLKPLRRVVKAEGILTNTWVILGAPFALAFGLLYLKFLFQLPAKIRYLFILAGATYVSGAVVLEAIDGYFQNLYKAANKWHGLVSTSEELFELTGIVIFVYALTSYLSSQVKELHIILRD